MKFYIVTIHKDEVYKLDHLNMIEDKDNNVYGFIICCKNMAEAAAYIESFNIMTVRFDWEIRKRAFYFMNTYNMDILFI